MAAEREGAHTLEETARGWLHFRGETGSRVSKALLRTGFKAQRHSSTGTRSFIFPCRIRVLYPFRRTSKGATSLQIVRNSIMNSSFLNSSGATSVLQGISPAKTPRCYFSRGCSSHPPLGLSTLKRLYSRFRCLLGAMYILIMQKLFCALAVL